MKNTSEYEKFRKPIEEIINFTNTLDEEYREKCFEILFTRYLSNHHEIESPPAVLENKCIPQLREYPPELKAFIKQHGITEEIINKLFLRESGEIHPIYKITEKKRATAQIQVALLTAFENALVTPNGAFEFSMKNARERCVDYNVYDGNDFIFNFKKCAGLFSNVDAEVVKLTPIGKDELANLIATISKQ
ncbi:MAG: hypothetical protein NWE96_07370 [Candidatus Bathyarchaeota archaeon]|nr:hypothetical protein [Candidatus Bathyarchaeota archaeon]